MATVAAAGGQLSELLPQLPVAQLVTVNLSLGFLVLLAPIAYQACMIRGEGTCGGLLLAGMFTFWAVIGQLVSVALLLGRSGLGAGIRLGLTLASVSALSLIGVYVWRSVTGLVLDAMTPGAAARTTAIL